MGSRYASGDQQAAERIELHRAYVANKITRRRRKDESRTVIRHIGKLQSVLKGIQRQLVVMLGFFKHWATVTEESAFDLEHFVQGGEVEYPARSPKKVGKLDCEGVC